MTPEHECLHSELLQNHSLEIRELETEIKFKREKIDNIQMKIEEMDKKLDQLILQSTKDDNELELRLKAIETELNLQKETTKNNHQQQQANYTKLATYGGIVSIALVILDLFLKYGLK